MVGEDIARWGSPPFRWYSFEEITNCPHCGRELYDQPQWLARLQLKASEHEEALAGIWGISYCPDCKRAFLWGDVPTRVQWVYAVGEPIPPP